MWSKPHSFYLRVVGATSSVNTPVFTVPDDEYWYIHSIQAACSASITLTVYTQAIIDAISYFIKGFTGTILQTGNIQEIHAVLPPNTTLNLQITDATGGTLIDIVVTFYKMKAKDYN